jgi:hypothetical protein
MLATRFSLFSYFLSVNILAVCSQISNFLCLRGNPDENKLKKYNMSWDRTTSKHSHANKEQSDSLADANYAFRVSSENSYPGILR